MAAKTTKEALLEPFIMENEVKDDEWLSSGSTLLNLAASGRPDGALCIGKYFWIVGESSSGKTFLTLTCFAEAARNPRFDEYRFIFDNAEDGALMDLERYFGAKMAARMRPPRVVEKRAVYSHYIEDFYFNLDDSIEAVLKGKAPPFVYLLDSMDALNSKYARAKFEEKKTEARGGKKAKGDYGDGKAKINSTWIRDVTAGIRDSKSILIVLSQSRDNIDAGMFEPKETHAGGRALKFYSAWQLWSSIGTKMKKDVNGTNRQIGIIARCALKKNRLTGKEWTVNIPIYHSTGIDDTGACVDFLVDEGKWKKNKAGGILVPDFDFEGNRAKLIQHIESNDLEFDMQQEVVTVWREIEAACAVKRKPRYS